MAKTDIFLEAAFRNAVLNLGNHCIDTQLDATNTILDCVDRLLHDEDVTFISGDQSKEINEGLDHAAAVVGKLYMHSTYTPLRKEAFGYVTKLTQAQSKFNSSIPVLAAV